MTDEEEARAAARAQTLAETARYLTTPAVLQNLQVTAKFRRALYLAYAEAGFSPGEALYLCTKPLTQGGA